MDAIAITLNGGPVSGRPGMTILDLAREVGIKIPTLCHDPSLKPAGVCRICLVEEEKSGRLLASCVTPIAAGMVINTQSQTVIENRKVIVKLMLASHPESCILCSKGNRCQLRALAADLGIGAVDYYPMPKFKGTRELNPFIARDLSKCVLCGKCIRADQELVVVGALDYLDRGFNAVPATIFDGPMEGSDCTFCGTCVTMCPTGALFERGKPHIGTPSARTPSVCSYCGCGCNIFLETSEGRVVSVSPNTDNSLNGWTLCVKGHYGSDYIHHRDRLGKPMVRKEGALKEVEWDEALDFTAKGLMNCYSQYGADAMAFFGSSKCTNEENYLFQKIARAVFGTNNIDSGARFHSGPSVEALPFGAMTNPMSDIEHSDAIFVIGSNPSTSHPVASYGIKRAARIKGTALVVIGPRKTGLASMASAWVQVKPGTDAVLLNGILRAVLESGDFDRDFVEANCTGIDELRESLAPFDLKFIEKRTGCPPALFSRIIDILKGAKSPAFVYGHGLTRQAGADESIRAVINLALLKGSIGRQGGGIYPLDKESNGQGAWDMGCRPDRLPGSQRLDDEEAVRRFETGWRRQVPKKPGYRADQMIRSAGAGTLKAMYIMGENPVRAFPGSSGIEKALGSLDFLVVQDLFPTETASLAHVVLPASGFAEKNGTYTNIERRIQQIRGGVGPVGESRPDFEVLCRLSELLGYPMNYGSPSEVMDEIASLVPPYSGISFKKTENGGIFWPLMSNGPCDEGRLCIADWGNGKIPLAPAISPAGEEAERDPDTLTLVRGSTLFHFLSGTRSSRSARLGAVEGLPAPGTVEINPSDADRLALGEGETVRVRGGQADIRATLAFSDNLPEGMLFCPYHDQALSALFSPVSGPGGAASTPVRLEKES